MGVKYVTQNGARSDKKREQLLMLNFVSRKILVELLRGDGEFVHRGTNSRLYSILAIRNATKTN